MEAQTSRPELPLSQENLPELARRLPVPGYTREGLTPSIVHVGVGAFHRAHQALYLHELMEAGTTGWSIAGAGVMPADASARDVARNQDCLYTLIEKDAEGRSARVVGSIVEFIFGPHDPEGLVERMAAPTTRIVSLTITEAGYPINEQSGEFDPSDALIAADLAGARHDGPPASAIGIVAEALIRRMERGLGPFTVQSCDNVLHNGDIARSAVTGAAAARAGGYVGAWLERHGAFPNSMVDRITPAATPADREWLRSELGVVDGWHVGAEPYRRWVMEDAFAAGRPAWEDVGALITADVHSHELVKIRLLNASHSAIAYLGAVVGHEYIHEAVADELIGRYFTTLMDREIDPTLPQRPELDLPGFKKELVVRFLNPEIQDRVDRVCLDGSSKHPKFTLPIVRDRLAAGGSVDLLALGVAAWCHYLGSTTDERGGRVAHAADPYLDQAMRHAAASGDDPARFLDFEFVFGRDLPTAEPFRSSFVASLRLLRERGVHATLASALSGDDLAH